jgi:hypothetical protein
LAEQISQTFDLVKVDDWPIGEYYVGCVARVRMQAEAQV